jgi:hypothetical protein
MISTYTKVNFMKKVSNLPDFKGNFFPTSPGFSNNTIVMTALATIGKYNVNGCPPFKAFFLKCSLSQITQISKYFMKCIHYENLIIH